jgi:predicted butyrate kinase (DUF1464 family)
VVRAIGIDPGTVSFDVCGLDGDRLFIDETLPTEELGAEPGRLVDLISGEGPVDIIVGPSGYGLPWVGADDVGPGELDLLLLGDERGGETGTIIEGMGAVVGALRDCGLPMCFAPGVIHLPSVPAHRKVNRIDMGTADKLCAVALGVWDQSRRTGRPYDEASFIYVEVGGAFTAVIAVQDGRIVDGSGGTSGSMGFQSLGAMDGELAYLLRGFGKATLATGGLAWIAGEPDGRPEEVADTVGTAPQAGVACEAFLEDLHKRVAGHLAVLGDAHEILLSGRLSRVPYFLREVTRRLGSLASVRRVEGFASVAKEAAQGAALLGQGLLGHPSLEGLVDAMDLRRAGGSVLDHLYVGGAAGLRQRYPAAMSIAPPFWQRS